MDITGRHRVVVVGGGLSGLFVAVELVSAGIDDMAVLEASDRPGGVVRTMRHGGYEVEAAAGTLLLPHPHLSPLLARLGIGTAPAAGPGTRYVYTGDRLEPMPASPKAVLSPVVSWRGKLRAAAEPFVTAPDDPEDESLDTFLRRRLGDEAGRLAAWLAAAGVFAGDPARLSARSAFPALAGMEESAGSLVRAAMRRRRERPHGAPRARTYVPFGGMAAVARAAASFLGDRFRPGFEVAAVSRDGDGWVVEGADDLAADHVVLACRPARAADLLGGDIAAVLRRAVSAPVVVVGLGGEAGRLPIPPGFGALAGPDAGTVSLGVLFESSYAPDRAPIGHSLVKVVAGGATRPEVAGWDDDRIVTEVGTEVARMLGHDLEVGFGGVVRHDPGIPQYPVGHGAWLADVENLRRSLPGLHLTGWGYRGVGVANLATDARAVAGKITGVAGRG